MSLEEIENWLWTHNPLHPDWDMMEKKYQQLKRGAPNE